MTIISIISSSIIGITHFAPSLHVTLSFVSVRSLMNDPKTSKAGGSRSMLNASRTYYDLCRL